MPDLHAEEWRRVVGFEDYEVSNLGRLRGWRCHSGGRRKIPKILKAPLDQDGYPRVSLCSDDGKRKTRPIHQLVLEAFVGTRPPGTECRHFPDRTRSNCRLDNLSWGTVKENAADREFHGTAARGPRNGTHTKPGNLRRGSNHGMSKLTDGNARVVMMLLALPKGERPSLKETGKAFRVSFGAINFIKRGRTWRHVAEVA